MKAPIVKQQTYKSQKEKDVLRHITTTSKGYKIWVAFLVAVILSGFMPITGR